MDKKIFETRQRAQELLKEAVSIWRQSDQSDYLEGIENDPVLSMLMMAIAYQGNEIDSEIEHLKEDVLDEFARMLAPYELGHATPATMVVSTALQSGVTEVETTPDTVFLLAKSHPFIPLLRTRVLNVQIGSVVRLDGRRWKVVLNFATPVKDLSGFAFAIDGLDFRDLIVTTGKMQLPLIKPWDYSDQPFNDCFLPQNMLYNRQQVCNMSMLPLDLFARHNMRLYCVDNCVIPALAETDAESLELIFEFTGINEKFLFDKTRLMLNTMVLVNAQMHECTLSAKKPFDRIAGYSDIANEKDLSGRQFMHLLQPAETQLFGTAELEVRRVDADRFNQAGLVKLIHTILNKYHSDFYAFQSLKGLTTDKMLFNLHEALKAIMAAGDEDALRNVPGIYLMLRDKSLIRNKEFSMSVKYLTTAGAAVNTFLSSDEGLIAPSGFDTAATTILGKPIPGTDDLDNDAGASVLLRYYMLTNDRIVTPADIKIFCYKELVTRYGLSANMIRSIRVSRRQTMSNRDCGYELLADITLADNTFIRRSFENNLAAAEILLQKMIEVRTTGVYPVIVSIKIADNADNK